MTFLPSTVNIPASLAAREWYGNSYSPVTSAAYRSGATQAELLETIKNFLSDTLVPYLETNFNGFGDGLDTLITGIPGEIATAVSDVVNGFEGYALAGPGIDLTGATDSTVAVQAFLAALPDGASVTIPSGATIQLTDTLYCPRQFIFRGSGTLRWTAGVASKPGLDILGAGTVLDGIRLVNAGVVPAATGDKQYGIAIEASNVTVQGVTVDGFQQGIAVMPGGEHYGATITGNHVLNVPGSGPGPNTDAPGTNIGEDRGDGISVWGAESTVTGNRVTAASGTDARIGIHFEALPNLEAVRGAHSSSHVTIANNVVTGRFRRSIVCEEIWHATITGNSVADATWWGIAIIGGVNVVVSGNAINWTRTATDNQGASWNPNRAGIMLYGHGENIVVDGNVIATSPGAALPFGIYGKTVGSGALNGVVISRNTIRDGAITMNSGIYMNGGSEPIGELLISENLIRGYNSWGIWTWNCADPIVSRNNLRGESDKRANGIGFDGSSSGARCDGNNVHNAITAIKIVNRWQLTTVLNNMVFNSTTGTDWSGTSAQTGAIAGNLYIACTTAEVH